MDLSSRLTFFVKFGLPLFWLGMVVAVATRTREVMPEGPRAAVLVMVVLAAVLLGWVCVRLKRVRLDDRTLYVSNYLREITVPLDAVVRVEEQRWVNIRPITLVLKKPGPFGDRIMFMPPRVWPLTPFSPHPMAEELREMTGR